MSKWPKDNQADLLAFYGTPGVEVERQLVNVVPPFRMTYEGKPVKAIRFHRKAAGALTAALREIWEHYDRDQRKIDALGISKYAGAYNPRKVRGSATKWSNHAYGAAIDLNAEENGFGKGHGTMPQPVIDAFKRQGARWYSTDGSREVALLFIRSRKLPRREQAKYHRLIPTQFIAIRAMQFKTIDDKAQRGRLV